MNADFVINEFLSDPRISFYVGQLRSDVWNKLNEKEKKMFFVKFNVALCEYLDIFELSKDNDFDDNGDWE